MLPLTFSLEVRSKVLLRNRCKYSLKWKDGNLHPPSHRVGDTGHRVVAGRTGGPGDANVQSIQHALQWQKHGAELNHRLVFKGQGSKPNTRPISICNPANHVPNLTFTMQFSRTEPTRTHYGYMHRLLMVPPLPLVATRLCLCVDQVLLFGRRSVPCVLGRRLALALAVRRRPLVKLGENVGGDTVEQVLAVDA